MFPFTTDTSSGSADGAWPWRKWYYAQVRFDNDITNDRIPDGVQGLLDEDPYERGIPDTDCKGPYRLSESECYQRTTKQRSKE